MEFYDKYKSYRNYMRRFSLVESLLDVWRYSLHILDDVPLSPDYGVGRPWGEQIKRNVWPWDLDVITREIVLHARTRGDRSLRRWKDLAEAINHIRHLDGESYMAFGEQRDVLLEMHRVAHRQFPWQFKTGVNPLMRSFKIFGRPGVDEIVVRELGMTMRQVLVISFCLIGHFQKSGWMRTDQDSSELKIPRKAVQDLLRRFTSSIERSQSQDR